MKNEGDMFDREEKSQNIFPGFDFNHLNYDNILHDDHWQNQLEKRHKITQQKSKDMERIKKITVLKE